MAFPSRRFRNKGVDSVSGSKKYTQAGIARAVGVSQTTVSNALNGKRELCTPQTYDRIWGYVGAVGYRGRGLVKEASPLDSGVQQVGLLYGRNAHGVDSDAFTGRVRWALEETLAASGVACISLGQWDQPREKLLRQLSQNSGGNPALVVLGEVPLPFLEKLQARVPRIVTIGAHYPELAPAVISASEQAVDLLVGHLAQMGHARVVWFGGPAVRPETMPALTESCLVRHIRLQSQRSPVATEDGMEFGRRSAEEFLRRRAAGEAGTTGVICADGMVAAGAVEEFRRQGVAVPADLSVVAVEGPYVRGMDTITTAGAEGGRIGATAAGLLLHYPSRLHGVFQPVTLPADLSLGTTTAPVARPLATGRLRLASTPSREIDAAEIPVAAKVA